MCAAIYWLGCELNIFDQIKLTNSRLYREYIILDRYN